MLQQKNDPLNPKEDQIPGFDAFVFVLSGPFCNHVPGIFPFYLSLGTNNEALTSTPKITLMKNDI